MHIVYVQDQEVSVVCAVTARTTHTGLAGQSVPAAASFVLDAEVMLAVRVHAWCRAT